MDEPHPIVRYLIVCEDVLTHPDNPNKVTLVNLISSINSTADPHFPFRFRELCVFLQLTECRKKGDCRVEITRAESNALAFRTQQRSILLSSDPLEVVGVTFRIRHCTFAEPGLYWVQFWYDEQMLAQQPLVLR